MYKVSWRYKPFLSLVDLAGYILVKPFVSLKDFPEIKRILVIRIDEIGDVLLTIPLLRALKEKFPKSEINVLMKKETKIILEDNKNIDKIIICEKPWLKNKFDVFYFLKLIKKLKKENFDLVVELHPDARNILLAFFAGKYRIGYRYRGFGFLLNKSKGYREKSIVEQNLDILKKINIETKNKKMGIILNKKDEIYIDKLIKNINKKFIVIHPSSGRLNKYWLNERWAEVADYLIEKYKIDVVFTGTKDDNKLINEIINNIKNQKNTLNLAGKTSIKQIAALLKKSRMFIGTDNGIMHITRALDVPLIGLFGPTNPKVWGYNDEKSKSVYKKIECSFCDAEPCRAKNKDLCMKMIYVNDVLKSVKSLEKYLK